MNVRKRTVLSYGAFLIAGILIGAILIWMLTGAGQRGDGLGRAVLDTPETTFALSGDLSKTISPGVSAPLDLTISNPNDTALSVSVVLVTVSAVDAPNATTLLPCTVDDFEVDQLDKTFTVIVAAGASTTLSESGEPSTGWPQVGMVLDESSNQDGCKGASLTLSYTAIGRVDQ